MKVKNLNKSSIKTRKIIKKTFAELLAEKKELDKITVTELVNRAEINRGTFYAHYDDIYSVAEDYESELIEYFFDNTKLIKSKNFYEFIDLFFDYFKKNDENYKMLCRSNDFLFAAQKITSLASNKILELCYEDYSLKRKKYVDLEINIFIEGLVCEYVKYCRNYSSRTLDELYEYTIDWFKTFEEKRLK